MDMKTMKYLLVALLLVLLPGQGVRAQKPTALRGTATAHGPESGALLVIGGGTVTPEIWDRFLDLAGGQQARIVVITNASGDTDSHSAAIRELERRLGADRVIQMCLQDIREANDPALIAPLTRATGIYFTGGRQWRISEVYLNTLAHQAMWDLLDRGGVIAGSSAGASIQGSLLWRGDTSGPDILVRNRQHDLKAFIDAAPDYIGIGIDESTAIEVHGDTLSVVGKSYVAVHAKGQDGFRFLRPGQTYDLHTRQTRP